MASDAQDNEISRHGDFSLVQTKASGARDLVWGVAGWLGGLVPRGPGKMCLCPVSQLRSSWMGRETHPYPLPSMGEPQPSAARGIPHTQGGFGKPLLCLFYPCRPGRSQSSSASPSPRGFLSFPALLTVFHPGTLLPCDISLNFVRSIEGNSGRLVLH